MHATTLNAEPLTSASPAHGATIAPAPFIPGEKFEVQLPTARVSIRWDKSRTLINEENWMPVPAGYGLRLIFPGETLRLTDCLVTGSAMAPKVLFQWYFDRKIAGQSPDIGGRTVGDSHLFFRLTKDGRDCDEAELLKVLATNCEIERLREIAWIRAASSAYSDSLDAGNSPEETLAIRHEVMRRMDEAKLQGRMEWDERTGVMQIFHPDAEVEPRDDAL